MFSGTSYVILTHIEIAQKLYDAKLPINIGDFAHAPTYHPHHATMAVWGATSVGVVGSHPYALLCHRCAGYLVVCVRRLADPPRLLTSRQLHSCKNRPFLGQNRRFLGKMAENTDFRATAKPPDFRAKTAISRPGFTRKEAKQDLIDRITRHNAEVR